MTLGLLLTFDPESEQKLVHLQDLIKAHWSNGDDEQSQSHPHITLDVRPHITLGGFGGTAPDEFIEELRRFAAQQKPLKIQLASLGTFAGGEGVLFLAPVVTDELLKFHSLVHTHLLSRGDEPIPYYLPGAWVPHVTIAVQATDEHFPRLLRLCRQVDIFGEVWATHLSFLDYPPLTSLADVPLGIEPA